MAKGTGDFAHQQVMRQMIPHEDNRGQQRQRHTQQRLESGDRPRPGDGSDEQDCHE